MDITSSATATATTTSIVLPTKSPEAGNETPPRIQPTKPISFSNGVLKRHPSATHNHHAPPGAGGVTYKECLKNHAASLGGHALDGCGEFMPAPTATASDPTSLTCAACGCHRNFHRREPEKLPPTITPFIEYHPHHRHHPLPPPPAGQAAAAADGVPSPGSQSPPPISSSYFPGSAPHMLLALSGGPGTHAEANNHHINLMNSPLMGNPSRKRFRTKFSQDQKEKMYELAEKVGWKMQKTNENLVNGICNDIGVERGVFKVWMHNNKNNFANAKRSTANSDANGPSNHTIELGNGNGSNESNAPTNGSSSSS